VRSSGGAFQTTNARVEKPKGIEPRGEPAIVTMTDTAARKVPDMRLEKGKPEWGLRIRVVGGGCSGMFYELGWEDQAAPDDNVFESQEARSTLTRTARPISRASKSTSWTTI
jgi:hypothetical protein